jgi:hypothetical protein
VLLDILEVHALHILVALMVAVSVVKMEACVIKQMASASANLVIQVVIVVTFKVV